MNRLNEEAVRAAIEITDRTPLNFSLEKRNKQNVSTTIIKSGLQEQEICRCEQLKQ